MEEKPKIAILILAAGSSSRMGTHIKQLLPWNGSTLLENAIIQAEATQGNATYVVLGAYKEEIIEKVAFYSAKKISNTEWENGLGSSIAAGINFFTANLLFFDAVLIMLADQPFITADYLNTMMNVWRKNSTKIITTHYKNSSGVPAIFGKEYLSILKTLTKDYGAKEIIKFHKNVILEMNPKGKQIDIDHWETYKKHYNTKS